MKTSAQKLEYSRAWYRKNQERVRTQQKEAYKADPEKQRNREWARKVKKAGRPPGPGCDLCGCPPSGRKLAFDHNHATGDFRGWLCFHCNTALGHFDDSPDRLRAALRYLATRGHSGPDTGT